MKPQNFANHTRFVPVYHFVLNGLILASVIASLIHFFRALGGNGNIYDAGILLMLSLSLLIISWYARVFALKAQDRAIRAEENFRHYLVTGKPLPGELRMSQIVALRFAADEELAALTTAAVTEKLSAKEIKSRIKDWRADYYRV